MPDEQPHRELFQRSDQILYDARFDPLAVGHFASVNIAAKGAGCRICSGEQEFSLTAQYDSFGCGLSRPEDIYEQVHPAGRMSYTPSRYGRSSDTRSSSYARSARMFE
jgi:hypothetical protein